MDSAQNDLIFIVGCPRSGTYLFSLMLSSQLPVAVPVETHFLPLFRRFLPLWGDLNVYENRELLLKNIYEFLKIWTPRSERERDLGIIRQYSLLATQARRERILKNSGSYQDLVANLYNEFATLHGVERFGDKSAFFRHVPLACLQKSVRKMKVIHLLRDGRDVALSWMGIWSGPETIAQAAWTWARHVREKSEWGRRHPDKYLEIKYEDLLARPEQVMKQVAGFLGLPASSKPLDFHRSELAKVLAAGAPHHLINKPLDAENKGKWRRRMSESDLYIFERLAGRELARNGYPLASIPKRPLLAVKFAWSLLLGGICRLFSKRETGLMLKALLPSALFLCSRCRVPLVRILNRKIGFF
ncbi:MAG: sulfotransferase [Thermodesulfobacteriota bacterium]